MATVRSDGLGRVLRSMLQLVASGALTAVVAAVAGGLTPGTAALVLAVWNVVVVAVQNGLEEKGVIPAILKPATVGPVVGEVVDAAGTVVAGVVGATAAVVEGVAGTVIDDLGDIVGGIGPKEEGDQP